MFTTLIDATELAALDPATVRLFDCRFDLADPDAGRKRFDAGHIPGATYLHLDDDLAGPVAPGRTGRHPLPDREAFRSLVRRYGVTMDAQIVAYDDAGGMFAARLWWMCRWAGHHGAAVLDGGYSAWQALDPGAIRPATPSDRSRHRQPAAPTSVSMPEVRENLAKHAWTLLDARAPDRFDGSNETIDPRGGHIAGAVNAPFQSNLGADGRFLDDATLRARCAALVGPSGKPVVCYCGSGVTAAHNILAMVHAGLPEPALYAGSWSEWITDPDNPLET